MNNLIEETKFILKKYGITANKNLGQNFLIDEEVVNQIVQEAKVNKEDLVIEIGPGLGTLTQKLLEKAGKVIAIELDKRMVEILSNRFKLYKNFELMNEDVLKVNLKELINSKMEENNAKLEQKLENTNQKAFINLKTVKIVANLPYYITTPIVMKLLEEKLPIESITVMVQKEVADRLIENPGGKNSGAITYSVSYYAKAKEILKVKPNSFIPEPSVESKVIQLEIRTKCPIQVENEALMFKIIKYAFMQRRKTFVNALEKSEIFHSKAEIIKILNKIGQNEKVRGETLSLEDYANITNSVTKM